MRLLASVVALCALALIPSWARLDPEICGTHSERNKEELFLHRQAVRKHGVPRQRTKIAAPDRSAANDAGQIALIDDSDGVIGRRNEFDLDQKTLSFLPVQPTASTYTFQLNDASYDSAAAGAGRLLALADDDTKPVSLPFAFPFFGATYQQIYVNSDGNLTFTEGDSASADRSLGRLTSGPPRIAPLFTDLNPSLSSNGVLVTSEPGRFIVSWVNVPTYAQSGLGTIETFQVRLYPDGRIEFTWPDVTVSDAVVGIAPGRAKGQSAVVSFASLSSAQFTAAVAERFSGTDAVDIVTTAQKFYQTHEDAYDYLVIFNSEGVSAAAGAVAYEVTARNQRTGFGDQLVNDGPEYGSPQRLQAVLNMGPLNEYPADPNAIVPARSLSRDTPMTILGHEAGHLFLAFASVADPNNPGAKPMLGRQLAHWSFLFNSEASFLEGNRIQDNGPGASPRFTTVATVQGYAPLDQYLMGFRAPAEVAPTFLVADSPTILSGSISPEVGISFDGTRRDITVENVIHAVGRRTPDSTVAQRRFRFAFLLVVPAGVTPPADQIAQLETYRGLFENFYASAASNRASAEATLKRALHLSVYPAAGLLAGSSATATLTLDSAAPSALNVLLQSTSGLVKLPSSVTIPAGASQASFSIAGLRAGVDSITAQPADSAYETAFARIQVAAGAGALTLAVLSGDNQPAQAGTPLANPIVLRVSDTNQLPYPNLVVKAKLTGGGMVDSATATTDANGLVQFRWTPGAGPLNELTASIDGGPSATVAALGVPITTAGSVVNAASYAPGLTPGSIATLFGANLVNASLKIGGVPAHVFFEDNTQINFLVPATLTGNSASLQLTTPLGSSTPVQVPVVPISPGIFAAVGHNGFVEIYSTGLGPVDQKGNTVNAVQALIGGVAAKITYSGRAPGFPGLDQVNAQLTGSGKTVTLVVAGKSSNSVAIR